MFGATLGVSNEAGTKDYNAWDEIKDTKDEKYYRVFIVSNNSEYTFALKRQIDMEQQDARIIAAAGWKGIVASLFARAIDPLQSVPMILAILVAVQGCENPK